MSLSVLLVDDDPERAAIVEPALREAGYEVVTVVDTATEMLAQVRARLAGCDHHRPRLAGPRHPGTRVHDQRATIRARS